MARKALSIILQMEFKHGQKVLFRLNNVLMPARIMITKKGGVLIKLVDQDAAFLFTPDTMDVVTSSLGIRIECRVPVT